MILFLLIPIILPNEDCKSRPSIILLGEGLYPGAVSLNRCAGTCGNVTNKQCIGHEEIIHLNVFNRRRNRKEVLEVVNHTACSCGCIYNEGFCYASQQWNNETCQCTCLEADQFCPTGYQWNPGLCGCECDKVCTARMYLNSTSCTCECMEKFYKRCMRKGLVIDTDCKCRVQSSELSSPRRTKIPSCLILLLLVCIVFGVMGYIIIKR